MLRLTVKNLVANRVRFAMTTFAVVLAVAFVVSSFVLTDGLRSSFNDLSTEIVSGTDLEIRPIDDGFGTVERIPESLIGQIATTDGVASSAGLIEADMTIRPINAEGEKISTDGPPQLTFGWIDDPGLSSFRLIDGDAPRAGNEFSMDFDAAATHGFDVGATYDVITPRGVQQLTLSGLTSFGQDNATLGATLMQMNSAALQDLLGVDGFDSIVISVEETADAARVMASLANLAPGYEVVDNATIERETAADFNQGIDIIGNALLGFAGVSLFVSIFIIANTFNIVLGQRTRELALLRVIGADPRQLRRSVQGEALVIGSLASFVGIGVGVLVAIGLRALFGALGAELPDSPTIVSVRTIAVALAVGVGATFLSAIVPARKAARVPAIAALRDGADAGPATGRHRLIAGAALITIGSIAGGTGLFLTETTTSVLAAIATGAVAIFVGVTLLSPLAVRPLTAAIGFPLSGLFGVSGRLATQNAGRNPRRTSSTAAALMVGLALVTTTLVVGESVKAQFRGTLESSVKADYLVTEDVGMGFEVGVADQLDSLAVTDDLVTFRYDQARIDGDVRWFMGTDLSGVGELFDLGISEGSLTEFTATDPLLISDNESRATGLGLGDRVTIEFGSGMTADLTIVGVFTDDTIIDEPYLIDRRTWDAVGARPMDDWIAFSLVDGVTTAQAAEAFAPLTERYPQADIATFDEFVEQLEGFIDQALTVVNVMVALAIIIALIGIANTLALSVFERTRELGLLRAVGMGRRQLRRMVRFEATLVAVFGAGMGVAVGLVFGWATVTALPDTVTSTLSIPGQRIAVLVAVAALAGLLAAMGPARRAARLDILAAISA